MISRLDFMDAFLEIQEHPHALIWIAGPVKTIEIREGRATCMLDLLPFRWTGTLTSAENVRRRSSYILLAAHGAEILRFGFEPSGADHFVDSPMLDSESIPPEHALQLVTKDEAWELRDAENTLRVRIPRTTPEAQSWIEDPREYHDHPRMELYPDGTHRIDLQDCDRFFYGKLDSLPLAFLEEDGRILSSFISFKAGIGEHFLGTGERFMERMKSKGFRITLWQTPNIGTDNPLYALARQKRYIAPGGNESEQFLSDFSGQSFGGQIDFTNPEAEEWYREKIRSVLLRGASAIKADFGERVLKNARYAGLSADRLHNRYALLYQRAVWKTTEETVEENPVIWARAGWAGCQRYPVHWGGDASSSWDGMAASLRGGLQLGLSGFTYWSHDIPGFHGVPYFMHSKPSLGVSATRGMDRFLERRRNRRRLPDREARMAAGAHAALCTSRRRDRHVSGTRRFDRSDELH